MIHKTGNLSLSSCMEPNMASYYEELYWDDKTSNPLPSQLEITENLIANKIWITSKKERIRVSDMTKKHLVNAINAFERGKIPTNYLGGKEIWVNIFLEELSRRKD